MQRKPFNFREYTSQFPKPAQAALRKMRSIVRKAAPRAIEKISYGMPAYAMQVNLVYFGAHKNHLGFYPGAATISQFQSELTAFKGAKGSVQFRYDQPIPRTLITRMVKYRMRIALERNAKRR